jgi:hypothetical protein
MPSMSTVEFTGSRTMLPSSCPAIPIFWPSGEMTYSANRSCALSLADPAIR